MLHLPRGQEAGLRAPISGVRLPPLGPRRRALPPPARPRTAAALRRLRRPLRAALGHRGAFRPRGREGASGTHRGRRAHRPCARSRAAPRRRGAHRRGGGFRRKLRLDACASGRRGIFRGLFGPEKRCQGNCTWELSRGHRDRIYCAAFLGRLRASGPSSARAKKHFYLSVRDGGVRSMAADGPGPHRGLLQPKKPPVRRPTPAATKRTPTAVIAATWAASAPSVSARSVGTIRRRAWAASATVAARSASLARM